MRLTLQRRRVVWFPAVAGHSAAMEQQNNPPATPKDATETTEEQRELQEQLNHKDDDPDAPGQHQDRHGVADET